jgi:large subunit ribosomal protein L1
MIPRRTAHPPVAEPARLIQTTLSNQEKQDMAKKSKAYRAAAAKIEAGKYYGPKDAVSLAKETGSAKFDSTVEVALKLGVDPRKADQMVRGTVILPHGTGKTARVVVFATGPAAEAAIAAGADEVGGSELIEKVAGGYTSFDAAVSTPELMGQVGRLGKVLGPRGLMPNPKTGTVTPDVAKAVSDIKGGKIEFRVDKNSNVHFVVGKASFSEDQLNDNLSAALDEIVRLKPSASKGRYIQKGALSTTFGPGIPLDVNVL